MSKHGVRSFASVLVCLTFLVVAASGLVLWLVPPGGGGPGGGNQLGISHGVWKESHEFVSVLLLVGTLLHLVFNWRLLLGYLRAATKGVGAAAPILAAVVLTLIAVGLGSMAGSGQAELGRVTVRSIAQRSGCSVDEVIAGFKKEGIEVPAAEASLIDLVQKNNVDPHQIMEIVQKQWPQALHGGRGHGPGRDDD